MACLCEGGNELTGSLKATSMELVTARFAIDYLTFALQLGKVSEKTQLCNQPKRESNLCPSATPNRQASALTDRATLMATLSMMCICEEYYSIESYPAFARIEFMENPGKNLNQIICPDRDSNPGHLVLRPDALTVTPQAYNDQPESQSEIVQYSTMAYNDQPESQSEIVQYSTMAYNDQPESQSEIVQYSTMAYNDQPESQSEIVQYSTMAYNDQPESQSEIVQYSTMAYNDQPESQSEIVQYSTMAYNDQQASQSEIFQYSTIAYLKIQNRPLLLIE
ncbi:hypothetical protein ANN_00162 [Periplaneta americana]|uniref:Uncharacterized protein n=1 Tax=Periplaneta americana TaxID=6978 RepID=A0ABQ8TSE7_PERAM|nr:hypothetical protein ANN_00162 [Periplaneta americana]